MKSWHSLLAILLLTLLGMASSYSHIVSYWHGYLNTHALQYYHSNLIEMNLRRDLNVPNEAVLFYGDSLIQGLAVQAASDKAVNYGIGHATTAMVYQQIVKHKGLERASVVVISVGINDILSGKVTDIIPKYRLILSNLPSDTNILIGLIQPIDEDVLGRPGTSKIISDINQGLILLCDSDQRVSCLSIASLLTNEQGQLASSYHIGDGLHLSSEANAIWLQQLQLTLLSFKSGNE